jgi:hypothetical protein
VVGQRLAVGEVLVDLQRAADGEDLDLRVAALGEDRLAIGAAELAFQALLEDPLQVA